jgi:antitoxin YefM
MIETSYSDARAHLAELLDRATNDHEVIRIRRQGQRPAAVLLSADDYASLEETAYLLASPANARRLLESLQRLDRGEGKSYASTTDLWAEIEAQAQAEDATPAQ